MDLPYRPLAGASSFFLHGVVSLLLLTGIGDAIWTHSCPGCLGPWSQRAEPVAAGHEVYRVPLRVAHTPPCPRSRALDREASLLPTSRLPVATFPVLLCLRVGRDGSVESVRIAYGVAAYDGIGVAMSDVRSLRFRPATAMGRPVSAWVVISIGGDVELPIVD